MHTWCMRSWSVCLTRKLCSGGNPNGRWAYMCVYVLCCVCENKGCWIQCGRLFPSAQQQRGDGRLCFARRMEWMQVQQPRTHHHHAIWHIRIMLESVASAWMFEGRGSANSLAANERTNVFLVYFILNHIYSCLSKSILMTLRWFDLSFWRELPNFEHIRMSIKFFRNNLQNTSITLDNINA